MIKNTGNKVCSAPLSLVVITYNEEENIATCIESVFGWTSDIFVIDSYSNDATTQIAKNYTDKIYSHPFESFAAKRNWALDNLPFTYDWIFFLDADERFTPELRNEIGEVLTGEEPCYSAFYINRAFFFMDRWLKHGGFYPSRLIKLIRRGRARLIDAGLREYFKVDGQVGVLKQNLIHNSVKNLSWWIAKHNDYASKEAKELLEKKGRTALANAEKTGYLEASWRTHLRDIWNKIPMFIRPLILFSYRYIFRLGFLDGIPGLIYCFLHDLWYPFLIDAKCKEIQSKNASAISLNRK